ncbi:MAG: 3-phosphoshikimate 1-carboxyvinyltransferase [Eubacteriales bacterium]|nr:3-phosphoshikimate 1-carboxyvinyltransferase [Eubacteriales bacterium]
MRVKIYPSSLDGEITAPPSKSMAHRHIICAALAEGQSVLENITFSDDIKATLDCVQTLGGIIEADKASVKITGFDIYKLKSKDVLFVNESGSTLRFLIPLCLLTDKKITLCGKQRLFERPLGIYEKLCEERGMLFERSDGFLTLRGKLTPGIYEIPGDVSSQFITGLLFALPLLGGDSEIRITGRQESAPYLAMTLKVLKEYGIKVSLSGNRIIITGNQRYISHDARIEGDYSNAAFFEALNLIGHNVSVNGLDENSLQGDKIYKRYFNLLGKEPLPLNDCPDLAPILLAMAAEFGGAEFTGTRRLRLKESDRGEAMAAELAKFGAKVSIYENSITVSAEKLHAPSEILESHGDHRIVMALAVLCTKYGGEINNPQAVAKSMPDFFERLASLGAKTENED